jgi:hypothetical protein
VDRVRKATGEELDLLEWREWPGMRHPGLERFLVPSHRAWKRQPRQVGEVVGGERRSEALVTERFEEGLGDVADVAGITLQHAVPVLGHAVHVERREPHLVDLRRALGAEEVLTLVQPRQRVVRPVERREGQLLEAGYAAAVRVALIVPRRAAAVGVGTTVGVAVVVTPSVLPCVTLH